MSKKNYLRIMGGISCFQKKTNQPKFQMFPWQRSKNPSGFRGFRIVRTSQIPLPFVSSPRAVDPTFAADFLVNVSCTTLKKRHRENGKINPEGWVGDLFLLVFLRKLQLCKYIHTLHNIYSFVSWHSGSRYMQIVYSILYMSIWACCWDTYPHNVKWWIARVWILVK